MHGVPLTVLTGLKSLDSLFGKNAYDRLFATRMFGHFDDEILSRISFQGRIWSDKELALARLHKQLHFYMQVTEDADA